MPLKDVSSSAMVAVRDTDQAKSFYMGTLGLPLASEMGEVFTLQTGATQLCVYRSAFAGTNQANAVVWDAGDQVEAIAAGLKAQGVTLEEYPDGFESVEDGIHRSGEFRAIWFKDPDGNILHVNGVARG